jgi:hypothetical protein
MLVTYELTVDDYGEETGFVYISRFWTVAQLQRSKIERAEASKQASLWFRRCRRRPSPDFRTLQLRNILKSGDLERQNDALGPVSIMQA